eukprot:9242927-Ditylum_brightwellii.AAC.1
MKNVEQLPLIFSVYLDFKEACTKFIDNYLGNISVPTAHRFMNQCLKAIVNHDTIFIKDDDSVSETESEYKVQSKKEDGEKSLDASKADNSSYLICDDPKNKCKEEAANGLGQKLSGVGSLQQLRQAMRGGYGINESTAYRWMCALGYKYIEQQKRYYVDAHEREDVV